MHNRVHDIRVYGRGVQKLNTELVGLSIDSLYAHIAWLRKIQEIEWNGMKNVEVKFPLIEDIRMEVASRYGMIQPGASSTQAVRAVFFIDPKGIIRTILYYPLSLGRNFDEIKRIILALQKADKDNVATPANWRPGDDVIIPTASSCGTAKERIESKDENMYCLDWFMCFRKERSNAARSAGLTLHFFLLNSFILSLRSVAVRKVLIIGGVAGGATCAARLRRLDESAQIIIFERGEYISYANCGLPYYVGDVIKSKRALLLQSPKAMKERYNIDVRIKHEVISIDREGKSITVINLSTGEQYQESYDTLVIATGSSPVRPRIEGIDSPKIHTLWTIDDSENIRKAVFETGVNSAAIMGGGFIGLEMAENLHRAGVEVTIIEMLDQVMSTLDYEMAQLLHENIVKNNVNLILGDGVEAFKDQANGVNIT